VIETGNTNAVVITAGGDALMFSFDVSRMGKVHGNCLEGGYIRSEMSTSPNYCMHPTNHTAVFITAIFYTLIMPKRNKII